jgi:hypothetical protein
MVLPRLFFDTNICINAASGNIPAKEWNRVRKHINEHFRYRISFITLKELLGKLARCADAYFERNKRPLHVLAGTGKRQFLPYPSVFALRTVLGMRSVSRQNDDLGSTDEEWAETVLTAVLQASSKVQLKAGIPDSRSVKRMMVTFDLDHFDRQENRPQNEHAGLLQGIREGRIDMPNPMRWAAWILHQHGMKRYTEQCEKLVVALDAAYRFSCRLSNMSKDKGYDFHAHATDWGDALQLFYLCDSSMHFLTLDRNCRKHTAGSAQASRILLYPEFVRSIL